MRKCAAVFRWIGGIASAILYIQQMISYGGIVLIVVDSIFLAMDILSLIWCQKACSDGRKSKIIFPAILCMIFCGVIGGILTLCIPEEQLGY